MIFPMVSMQYLEIENPINKKNVDVSNGFNYKKNIVFGIFLNTKKNQPLNILSFRKNFGKKLYFIKSLKL